MDPLSIGIAGLIGVLVLLALGCPVGLAMILAGGFGFSAIVGIDPALNVLETAAFEVSANYSFTLIPLFYLWVVLRLGLDFRKIYSILLDIFPAAGTGALL